jgi:hypothetical protein
MTRFHGNILLGLLAVSLVATPAVRSQEPKSDDIKKVIDAVRDQFPVLRNQGMPPLVVIADETLRRMFPEHEFLVLGFRQHPVVQVAPEPLKTRNLFSVKNGKVQHLTDTKALEGFFRHTLGLIANEKSARDSAEAWLRLSQEFKQDGFFKFSIPKESLTAVRSKEGWRASGKVVVMQGGKGEILATLAFDDTGKLTKVEEQNTVKPGVRPICQATKLLDADAIVRQMAEKDILVMGWAAKEYLEEQRAKAPPELRQAIDRIWQRIVDEEW